MSVIAPRSIAEALEVLDADPECEILAGGTDFMVEVNFDRRRPRRVVSLHRLDELRDWSTDDASVRIGAGVTCAALESPVLAALVPGLGQAARTVGSPQIRSAATIGGNLATASPAGDLLPVLSALDATVECARVGSTRSLSIHDFLVGPKRCALDAGELVTGVSFGMDESRHEFVKVGTRNAMVISVASVAAVWDGPAILVAMGSVGPTVMRARAAERWFNDRGADPDAIEELARRAADEASPIDDHRSTADYRRHAVQVCVSRVARRLIGGQSGAARDVTGAA